MVVPAEHAEFVRSFRAHAQDYVAATVQPAAANLVPLWLQAQRVDREIFRRKLGREMPVKPDAEVVEQFGAAIKALPDEMEAQGIRWAAGDETALSHEPLVKAIREFTHANHQVPYGIKGTRERADSQEAWAPFFAETNRVLATLSTKAYDENVLYPAADELVRPPKEQ